MEGGRRAAGAAAANQSNFTSGIEIDSVDSTLSINQSISQLMVYEDKEMVPKKVELLIRFFEPFWISRVFHFFLGTFEEVAGLPGPLEASDETYT